MDKQTRPFINPRVGREPDRYECMSYVADGALRGTVHTIGVRLDITASSWTHAWTEIDWGSVAELEAPATTQAAINEHHQAVVETLQAQPWPAGFDDAVRRWGQGRPVAVRLP